mmetsp:Transcript_13646/g.38408  ORF Transcript_13646/g.38408 Transcript_13646/m.38408 type:complete len:96 (+) Transcript_13646:211-498(+)
MIPRAIKRPEANSRAYIPRCVSRRTNQGRDDRDGDRSLAALRDRFHPVVWNGTIAFLKETTAVVMDPESVRNHPRAEVRTLLDRVGGETNDACLL